MKKPVKKDFCKPFNLDDNLIHFDSKSYAKQAELYIKQMENEKSELLEALKEVSKGEGAYDMDKLKHASNVIDNMKSIANEAIKRATE